MTETVTVCALEDLAAGILRLVEWEDLEILVANCGGTLHAIENRCSHDNGPLNEGELDESACTVECPRHGSVFDLRSGRPLCLPAYEPVDVFAVRVEDERSSWRSSDRSGYEPWSAGRRAARARGDVRAAAA